MVYPIDVAGLQRELPLCRVTNDLYIGAFVIFGDVELTVHAAKKLLEKAPEYDYLISAEAKGIPLIYEMARQSGQNKYFLARKGPKLYMSGVFDVAVHSISTAREQHLYLDKADAALMRASVFCWWMTSSPPASPWRRWSSWSPRPAASSQAGWPFWPRATRRRG